MPNTRNLHQPRRIVATYIMNSCQSCLNEKILDWINATKYSFIKRINLVRSHIATKSLCCNCLLSMFNCKISSFI